MLESRLEDFGMATLSTQETDGTPEFSEAEQSRAAQDEMARMLREGLNSGPATVMTHDDWLEVRRMLQDRTGASSASPP